MTKPYKIVQGEVFGNYTVLDRLKITTRSGNTEWRWKCIDKNGNFIYARPRYLISVLPKEIGKRFKFENSPPKNGRIQMGIRSFLFREYKLNSRKRKIEFLLDFEEFNLLITGNCRYCGSEPSENERFKNRMNRSEPVFKYNGVDRIDSLEGYTTKNTVSCCAKCNLMKNILSVSDFLSHIKEIYKFNFEGSTTIPKGSTLQANGNGNGVLPEKEEDIV